MEKKEEKNQMIVILPLSAVSIVLMCVPLGDVKTPPTPSAIFLFKGFFFVSL